MEEIKVDKNGLLNRYDAVFHMISVAVDLPEKYENLSNKMRRENIKEAKIVDEKLLRIWGDHPSRIIINNATGLEEKIKKVFDNMMEYIEREIGDNVR